MEKMYTDGGYLAKNPGWHVEESDWKASQVMRVLNCNRHIVPKNICEVGCGVGEVLKQLQERMHNDCMYCGYDISPQAIEIASSKTNERLYFKLADIRQDKDAFFDLMLVMDVLEHLEDYFSFLRGIRSKGQYKVFHVPLELSAQTILRGRALLWSHDAYGHIHFFTKETALQMIKDAGYEVLDYFYTGRATQIPSRMLSRKLLVLPRKVLFKIHQDLTSRTLGGFSLMVLAR